ncbi:hypothetical protein, partial [Streptomyces longispororuber]|uniref:hypothetical protein n=1 Tax=Streptomyces longispororuber TaxID=68230 RepID=UPI00210C2331
MPTSRRRPSATRLGLLREELRRIAATAPAPLSRPRSDPEIAHLVREGRPHHFAEAADRHRTSVTAYLATCFTDTVQRDDLAARVFEHTAAATAVGGLPGAGLRLQLLVNARTLAVRHWAHTPDDPALDPAFRAWAGLGGTWPMDLRSRLTEAYRLLPRRRRTLLWHGVIEGDSPRTAVLAAGVPADTYRRALDRAAFELRAAYLELHRSATLDLPDCADHASLLAAAVAEPASPAALDVLGPHLRTCPHCRTAHADLTDLPGQLRAQLPGMLLGWWDPHAYALARAALRAESATRAPARSCRHSPP